MIRLGQVGYEGYFNHTGGKSLVSGAPLPTWEKQGQAFKDAWEAAAVAIIEAQAQREERKTTE